MHSSLLDEANFSQNGVKEVIAKAIIFRLPNEVSRRVIELLDVADIVRLDAAVLSHRSRLSLQELCNGCVLSCSENVVVGAEGAAWLKRRGIYLTRLCICHSLVDNWPDDMLCVLREVVSLRFEKHSQVTDERMESVFASCPQLRILNLSDCRFNGDTLLDAATLCPLLQEVDLRFSNAHVSNLIPLVQHAARLTTINLASCLVVNNATIEAICTWCKGLTSLNGSGCTQLTGVSVDALAAHCPALQYLNMLGWSNVSDDSMIALAAGCPNLRGLHFGGCFLTTDVSLHALATNCSALEDITFTYARNVSIGAVVHLIQNCLHLKSFSGFVTDEIANAFALHSRQLESLKVGKSQPLCGVMLAQLLACCPALHTVYLMSYGTLPPASLIAGSVVANNMRVLNMSWCTTRTDEQAISLISFLPNLKELYMQYCSFLSDASVLAVAKQCPSLQVVELAGLKRITDTSVVALAESCPALYKINLSGCANLTDRAVVAIAEHCPLLTHLNIVILGGAETTLALVMDTIWGKHCSDVSIAALMRHCRRLRELKVCGHARMSKVALDLLMEALPRCRVGRG